MKFQRSHMTLLAAFLVASVVAFWFRTGVGPPHYSSFINRPNAYYAQVAKACEDLFLGTIPNPEHERTIAGDNPVLQGIWRELEASGVVIASHLKTENSFVDFVRVRMGYGPDGYTILWQPCSTNGNPRWELVAIQEERTRTLFTKEVSRPGPAAERGL